MPEFFLDSTCTYDATNKYAFVADYSGQISVLKLDTSGFQLITTLRGHQSENISVGVSSPWLQCEVCRVPP